MHAKKSYRPAARYALLGALIFFSAAAPACNNRGPAPPTRAPDAAPAPLYLVRGLELARVNHKLPASVKLVEEQNGLIRPRSWEFRSERLDHPGLAALREREKLDEVVAAGKDELDKMALLCDWVNSQWPLGTPHPYPPWDANQILDLIRSGRTGGFCAQYAVVLAQCCLALGWQARYLDVLTEDKKPGNGHFTVEVWSNQYDQWVLLDPFYDCRFERDGRPLSALQVHQALVSGEIDAVTMVVGKGKNALAGVKFNQKAVMEKFFHLSADPRNDHLSHPFNFWDRADTYLSWKDSATDGRPELYRDITDDPLDFDFPLNQAQARLMASAAPDTLTCLVRTNMPEAETLELKFEGGLWTRPPSPYLPGPSILRAVLTPFHGSVIAFDWRLHPGANKLLLRAVNTAGITGPATLLVVNYSGT
ncbi:MAG TPA: transglutaminase-like domain-containing protein [bacterium]|nr:transglutaminase-like domain-containing protein [bacterium]